MPLINILLSIYTPLSYIVFKAEPVRLITKLISTFFPKAALVTVAIPEGLNVVTLRNVQRVADPLNIGVTAACTDAEPVGTNRALDRVGTSSEETPTSDSVTLM